jgi:hypothetical protein
MFEELTSVRSHLQVTSALIAEIIYLKFSNIFPGISLWRSCETNLELWRQASADLLVEL